MYHPRLGEDPQWALYRTRERLDFTDPPTATTPVPRSIAFWRGVAVVALAFAVAATVRADTEPTMSQPGRIATTTRAPDVVETTVALVHAAPAGRHQSDTAAHHSEQSHSAAAIRPVAAHHRGRTER